MRRARLFVSAGFVPVALSGLAWGGWELSKAKSYQLFGQLVTRVEVADSVVALTFDDGPVAGYTDSVLAILAETKVPATFFVEGAGTETHRDITVSKLLERAAQR